MPPAVWVALALDRIDAADHLAEDLLGVRIAFCTVISPARPSLASFHCRLTRWPTTKVFFARPGPDAEMVEFGAPPDQLLAVGRVRNGVDFGLVGDLDLLALA